MYLLYNFNLPILNSKVYNKNEFTLKCNEVREQLINEYKENSKLWNSYLYYLGYRDTQIQELLKPTTDNSNKIILAFMRNIIRPFGMELQIKKDTHETCNHKYIFNLKEDLKRCISVFKTEGRIPLINYYENENTITDVITIQKLNKLKIILNS